MYVCMHAMHAILCMYVCYVCMYTCMYIFSIPASANQEHHVSMATFSARRLQEMCQNTRDIVTIEYLSAAQGMYI